MLKARHQAGFTLVEVMITVFVVAVGLLAAAALQAVAKKAAVDAMQRTTASVLAQDILERIRSNPGQLAAYAAQGAALSSAPAAGSNCAAAACTAEQLVSYDLAQWWRGLEGAAETISQDGSTAAAGGLRAPVGCIRESGNRVDVVIAWRGLTAITQAETTDADDPTADACGRDAAAFADTVAGSGQSYRRVLRLQAHLRT